MVRIDKNMRGALIAVLVLNTFVCGLIAWVLFQSYRQYQDRAILVTANLSRVLDENFSSLVDKVDMSLRTTVNEMERASGSHALDPATLENSLALQDSLLPNTIRLRVTNASGRIQYGEAIAGSNVNIADREYFTRLREHPDAELLVSTPFVGRIVSNPMIVLARRYRNPDGSFAGSVQAAVDLETLTSLLASVELPSGGGALWDEHLRLLLRSNISDSPVNTAAPPSPILAGLIRSHAPPTAYRSRSLVDKTDRQMYFRKLSRWPFYLVVGIGAKDFLAGWKREAGYLIGLAFLFMLASILVAAKTLGDITKRKAAEQALQKSEQFLRKAQAAGGVGCFSMEINLGIWEISETFDGIFGIGPEYPRDVAGWLDLVSPDLREFHRQQLLDLIQNKGKFDLQFRILRKQDGQMRWVSGQGNLECDAEGQTNLLVGTFQDITERWQAESDKLKLQEQLLQAQKMESLGLLAGGIAHDINNVLGAILGLASAHIGTLPQGSSLRQALDTICKATERGARMLKNLLSFARQAPAEERGLDLNEIIQEVIHLLECTTLSRVSLEIDLGPSLRPMLGDASALTHAFMNLCINAVDAMPDSGTLSLRTRNVDWDWIEVVVKDTGTGMSKEVQEKAMDPFYTTKPEGKGTGLGLFLVFSTVKAHRGRMTLQSELGVGTCVTLRFPASEASLGNKEPSAAEAAPVPRRPLQVLLVDDDDLMLTSICSVLEKLGHASISARSGEAALAQLEAGLRPDLVILDMNMPGLGGAGTLPLLRALRPDLPVLLSSGRIDQSILTLAASYPRVSLLPKPFGLRELEKQLGSG